MLTFKRLVAIVLINTLVISTEGMTTFATSIDNFVDSGDFSVSTDINDKNNINTTIDLISSDDTKNDNDDTSKENNDDTSKENCDDISKENSDDTSKENSDDISKESSDDTSKENSDDISKENSDDTSKENSDDTSKENSDDISKENSDDTSKENSGDISKENSDDISEENNNEISEDKVSTISEVSSEIKLSTNVEVNAENEISTNSEINIVSDNLYQVATESDLQNDYYVATISEISISTNSDALFDDINRLVSTNSNILFGTNPSKLILRNLDGKNYVTSVKDQDRTNWCELFSQIGAAETNLLLNYPKYVENLLETENETELDISEVSLNFEERNGIMHPMLSKSERIKDRGAYTWHGSVGSEEFAAMFTHAGLILDKYAPVSLLEKMYRDEKVFLPYMMASTSVAMLINSNLIDGGTGTAAAGKRGEAIEKVKTALNEKKAVTIGKPMDASADLSNRPIYSEDGFDYTVFYDLAGAASAHAEECIGYDDNFDTSQYGISTNGAFFTKNSYGTNVAAQSNLYTYDFLTKAPVFTGLVTEYVPTHWLFDNNYFFTDIQNGGDVYDNVEHTIFTIDGAKLLNDEEYVYGFGIGFGDNPSSDDFDVNIYELDEDTDLTTNTPSFNINDMTPIYTNAFDIHNNEYETFKVDSEVKIDRNHKYAFVVSGCTRVYIDNILNENAYTVLSTGEVKLNKVPNFQILTNAKHNVVYDANGGRFSDDNTKKSFILKNDETTLVEQPTYADMTFKGWSNKKDALMAGGLEDKYHSCYGDVYYAIWEANNGNVVHNVDKELLTEIIDEFSISKMSLQKVSFQVAGSLPQNITDSKILDDSGFVAYKVTDGVKREDGGVVESANTVLIYAPNGSKIHLVPNSLFDGYMDLKEIVGLNYCDVDGESNFSKMFSECTQLLGPLDLSSFKTNSATNMEEMFYQCHSLKKVYVSNNFTVTAVSNSQNMFSQSVLEGPNGTEVMSISSYDKTYAHIGELFWNAYPTIEFASNAVFAFGHEKVNGIRYYNEEYILPLGDFASNTDKEIIDWRDAEGNAFLIIPKGYDKDIVLTPNFNNDPYKGVATNMVTINFESKYGTVEPLTVNKDYEVTFAMLRDKIQNYDTGKVSLSGFKLLNDFDPHYSQYEMQDMAMWGLGDDDNPISITDIYDERFLDFFGQVGIISSQRTKLARDVQDYKKIKAVWTEKVALNNRHQLGRWHFVKSRSVGSKVASLPCGSDEKSLFTEHEVVGNQYNHKKFRLTFANLPAELLKVDPSYTSQTITYNGFEWKSMNRYANNKNDIYSFYREAGDDEVDWLLGIPEGHRFLIDDQILSVSNDYTGDMISIVWNFSHIFNKCRDDLLSIDGFELVDWGEDVDTLARLFYKCKYLERVNLSNIDFSKIIDTSQMFYGCENLTSVVWPGNVDFSSIRTSEMFKGCNKVHMKT